MSALKACKHCSQQVAKNADICPHCGGKLARTPIGCGTFVVFVAVAWAIGAAVRSGDPPARPAAEPAVTAPEKPAVKRPADTQKKLDSFVADAIRAGVFSKVECRQQGGTVGVTPAFMVGSFDAKQKVLETVWLKCFSGSELAVLRLVDSRTNRPVGTYIPGRLELD
jgi:hypothetical protein